MKAVYCLLPLGLVLSLAYALDQDADGISDVYADHHGLSAGSDTEDPDGDGQTNAEESAWGTDPFDAESKQTVAHSTTENLYDFSVPTLVGKRYQFQGSSDLLPTWIDIDIPFEGTGETEHLLTTTPIAGTDKFFWRVRALPEPDADGDGLGAFEESLLGTSDNATDSDGDQVGDMVEFLEGLDPASNLDTDNDGLPDDWELMIVRADLNDAIDGIDDVYASAPGNGTSESWDFDGDGFDNLTEFQADLDPADSTNGATTAQTSPSAPRRPIVIDNVGYTGVTLHWADNSDNELMFQIERAENNYDFNFVGAVPANTTTWSEEGLNPSIVYAYRIVARNNAPRQ